LLVTGTKALMRILVVEDDAPLASFVRKGLEAEHYAVDVAMDGELARRMATESEYDLLILDLNLPKLDGFGILSAVRPKKPSLPILVLTARSRVEDRVQSLDTGADDVLIKPFSFTELSARVRALLRRGPRAIETVLRVADLELDRVERRVERAGNRELGQLVAVAVDSRRVELRHLPSSGLPELLARLLSLKVEIHPAAKVVVSERTGTIVMGREVRLSAVSILHGDLSIEIATEYQVSQPNPLAGGQTTVVPETNLQTKDEKTKRIELTEGASIEQLVNGLQAIGATARDIVAILQAIKAAAALQAELEVI
jgi:CheY-like chemotaxis protein